MPEILGYQFDRSYANPIERYRQVSTIAERDAIPTGKRWEGMLCYVTGESQDYQLSGGLTNLDWTNAGSGNYFDTVTNDSDDITEGVTNLFLSPSDQAKLDFITITQAVDLDQLEIDVAALGAGVNFVDEWDASSGSFPGGGTTAIGDLYVVTTAGTVDGVTFAVGDGVIAKVVNASTTTFAANWIKTQSNSDVTSVVGLTGSISKTALLAALNVEDGATADMTGAELTAAITAYLTTSDWQTKLTNEEVLDFVGAAINTGTQTNIVVTYDDANDKIDFTVDPFIQLYADLATLILGQGSQVDDKLYEITDASGFTSVTSGRAWVRYLGTTVGDETDYLIVSKEESTGFNSPLTTKGDIMSYDTGDARLAVGTDGQVLTADSSEALGVKWSTPAGSGDMLASTYDPSGVASDAFEMDNMSEGLTTKILTDTERTKLTGIETGAEVNTVDSVNTKTGAVVLTPDDIPDRTLVNATVTTTQALDYDLYEFFDFIVTGAVTFTESNVQNKVIVINVTGNFAITYPAGWSTNITGTYDGTVQNTITVWRISSGVYKVQITQPD